MKEEDIFGNSELTPDFEEFLDFLGDRIQMKGFPHYRAGLDVKNDTTGLFWCWENNFLGG